MTNIKLFYIPLLVTLIFCSMSSCKKKDNPTIDIPITAVTNITEISNQGDDVDITITCEGAWKIEMPDDLSWLSASKSSGSGNDIVTLSFEANTKESSRSIDVKVSTVSDFEIVTITQLAFGVSLPDDIIVFKDENFKKALLIEYNSEYVKSKEDIFEGGHHIPNKIDANDDGEISYKEASEVERIFISQSYEDEILNIDEIEYFNNIQSFEIMNTNVGVVDFANNSKLHTLKLQNNSLTEIKNIDHLTDLEYLDISRNHISEIDITGFKKMAYFSAEYQFTAITYDLMDIFVTCTEEQFSNEVIQAGYGVYPVVDGEPVIEQGNIEFQDEVFKNLLLADKGININNDNEISYMEAYCFNSSLRYNNPDNQLTNLNELKYFKNINHITLDFQGITEIDVSSCTKLKSLQITNSKIEKIDLSRLENLTSLSLYSNNLNSLNLSNNTNITLLSIGENSISSIEIGHLTKLSELYIYTNHISSLDISSFTNLIKGKVFVGNQKNVDGDLINVEVTMTSAQQEQGLIDTSSPLNSGVTVNIKE